MTPEELARQAEVLVDELERGQTARITEFVRIIEQDFIQLLEALDFTASAERRAILELRVQTIITQSRAAQELLSMGKADGPLADALRSSVRQAYSDGIRTASEAAINTSVLTPGQVAAAQAFAPRIDLELIDAISRTTLTTLESVAERSLDRLEEELVRTAVRGAGPRAAARSVKQTFETTLSEAERITRTVFMTANNEARASTFRELGLQFLQYNATNDDRVCEYCEARHGMVYKIDDAPDVPIHPNCRCVLLPWSPDSTPEVRGDAYYVATRASMREAREEEGRGGSTATAQAPFERINDTPAPKPVWAPGRGFL